MRVVALAGAIASFLAILFGLLSRIDRSIGAARLRYALVILIGVGAVVAVAASVGGAESASRVGMRVAFVAVLVAVLRTDYALVTLGIGPSAARTMVVFAGTALVLGEVEVDYPSRAIRLAIFIAQAAAVCTVFVGFGRTAWVALRKASGRDTRR